MVRATADPDNVEAEFGVILRPELKGSGLGLLLMQKMIAYLRAQGTQRLVATVLTCNERMLKLAEQLGFKDYAARGDGAGTRGIFLALNEPAPSPCAPEPPQPVAAGPAPSVPC